MGVLDLSVGDVAPKSLPGCLGCFCCSAVWLIMLILWFPCTVVQLGQFKYGLARNKVSGVVDLEQVFTPGRYWIGFWRDFIEFPSTLQTIQFSNEKPESGVQALSVLSTRDQDGKQMFLDISVQYRLVPGEVPKVYSEMKLLYENIYISDLRDALSKVTNMFKITDLWEDYRKVVGLMKIACVNVLAPRHAQCWDLQLWGVKLDSTFENALIKTQVRKQAVRTAEAQKLSAGVRALTQAILAEYKKNITVVQATGNARTYEITRLAQATAEGNLISAQAKGLTIVKQNVKLGRGLMMNETHLITYQRLLMLQAQKAASFVYLSPPGAMESVNVYSSKKLLGTARRLREEVMSESSFQMPEL